VRLLLECDEAMARSLCFDRAGKTFIAAHGAKTLAPGEWHTFLAALEAQLLEIRGLLIFNAGASIEIQEREQLERVLTLGRLRVAVLTDSKNVRGAVTALSWFKIPIKSFASNGVELALDHLRVEKAERMRVYTVLAQLKTQILL
jgi:hypothetical protein